MEFYLLSLILNIGFLYTLPARAQTYVSEAVWVVPDGNTADLSNTYPVGLTLQVTWNAVPDGYQFQTLSNLWVTTWDYSTTPFSQLLTENVNTNNSGTYDWTITIPESVLTKDAKYVLRFKDLSSVYNSSSPEVSSTGFLLINGGSSSSATSSTQTSSSTSSTGSASATTAPTASSTAGVPTTSATSTPISEKSGLSGGAKAGIAIGVVGVALLIAGSAFLILRRRRSAKSRLANPLAEPPIEPPTYYDVPKQHSPGNENIIAEMEGHERAELQGS